jgi:hypothetical protein
MQQGPKSLDSEKSGKKCGPKEEEEEEYIYIYIYIHIDIWDIYI